MTKKRFKFRKILCFSLLLVFIFLAINNNSARKNNDLSLNGTYTYSVGTPMKTWFSIDETASTYYYIDQAGFEQGTIETTGRYELIDDESISLIGGYLDGCVVMIDNPNSISIESDKLLEKEYAKVSDEFLRVGHQ